MAFLFYITDDGKRFRWCQTFQHPWISTSEELTQTCDMNDLLERPTPPGSSTKESKTHGKSYLQALWNRVWHTHTHTHTRTDTLKVYQSCSYYSYKPLVHSCKETHHWRELSNRWCLWRHRHGYNLGSCGFIPSAGLWLTFVESPAYEQKCKYHQISRSPRAPDREAAVAGPCVAGCTSVRKRNQIKERMKEWINQWINQAIKVPPYHLN